MTLDLKSPMPVVSLALTALKTRTQQDCFAAEKSRNMVPTQANSAQTNKFKTTIYCI